MPTSAATGTATPRIRTLTGARNGRSRLGLAKAQPDDGDLRGREGEEDAEAVQAGQRPNRAERDGADEQRDARSPQR